jgi:hypothetical protein
MLSEQQILSQQLQQEKLNLASEKSLLETLARLHDATSPDISKVAEAYIPWYTVNIDMGIKILLELYIRGAVKKFPEFFGAPWIHTTRTGHLYVQVLQSLHVCSFEEMARQVAGRDSGFCITIMHRATHLLLCHHPATALSGSRSERASRGQGIKSNATSELRKIPKDAFRQCFQQW